MCLRIGGWALMTEFVFGVPPAGERTQMYVLIGTWPHLFTIISNLYINISHSPHVMHFLHFVSHHIHFLFWLVLLLGGFHELWL